MTEAEIRKCLADEVCLYDPQENVLYQPDVNGEDIYFGIQIFNIAVDKEKLREALREYKARGMEDKDLLYFWTRDNIPAPGVFVRGKNGYADWYGFECDEDTGIPSDEDTERNIELFAARLVREGIAKRLLTETEALENLGVV